MILGELSEAAGIAGQEDAVREIVLREIEAHASEIRVDSMGNVLAYKPGTDGGNRPRVMIAAHMDEVGFMVTGYDSDGLVRFDSVGGIDARILPGLRVKLGTNGMYGVVIWAPIHKNRDQNAQKLSSLRIDIGATSKSEAEGKAPLGTMIVFDSYFGKIGKLLRGKAFDDRAGCAMLIDVLAGGPYPCDILAAFTVQEEVGLRGATVAARTLQPDVAFVLETTTAFDLPDPNADPDDLMTAVNPTCKLGKGPALTVMDRTLVVNPQLLVFIRQTAESNNLRYQLKTRPGGGTDGGTIQYQTGGIATAVISLPARYIHSPVSLIDEQDYQITVELVQKLLQVVTGDVLDFV